MHVMEIIVDWMFLWSSRMTVCVIFCCFLFFWWASETDRCYYGWPRAASERWCLCSWGRDTVPSLSSLPWMTSRGTILRRWPQLGFGSRTDLMCLCLLNDSSGVMRIREPLMTASTSGIHIMSDIFKHPLTHISSIPKGRVEWLLVMLEQVLDIGKAFNLEDLWFLLDDLPEINSQPD